jgi:hypothetical protein
MKFMIPLIPLISSLGGSSASRLGHSAFTLHSPSPPSDLRLGSRRNLHARLSPHLTAISLGELDIGVRVAVEGTAVVRECSQTGEINVSSSSHIYTGAGYKPRLDHVPVINVTSPELEVAWHDVVARLVEEANPVVLARVPALRFFRPRASALRHGESAGSLQLETWVGVADVEVDGGASRSSGQSIEDDETGDVPWRRLDEGVAGTVSWLRGGQGVGEGAQREDGAQDCERVHVGLEDVG